MRLAALTLTALAFGAPSAGAQVTVTATPDQAGKAARLHVDADATQPPLSGRVPRETVLTVDRGYTFDGRAVPARCTAEQGAEDACPARSRIGSALVIATYGGTDFPVPVDLYLARPFEAGDVAGLVGVAKVLGSTYSATGRLVRRDGALTVSLSTPGPDPAAFGATIKSLTADVGVTRKVRRGKRKVKRSLLTNPRTCTGEWAASAAFTFSDGSTAAIDAPIACTP